MTDPRTDPTEDRPDRPTEDLPDYQIVSSPYQTKTAAEYYIDRHTSERRTN